MQDKLEAKLLAAVRGLIDPEPRNVYFLANNPNIDINKMKIALRRSDAVAQYNRPTFFENLSDLSNPKMHFFNANDLGSYWGFSKDGAAECDYTKQSYENLILVYTRWLSDPIKRYLADLPADAEGLAVGYDELLGKDYPEGKLPSVGFTSVVFMRKVNSIRENRKLQPHKLHLVGFSGVYPKGQAWVGHDFEHEQNMYALWKSNLVRISEKIESV